MKPKIVFRMRWTEKTSSEPVALFAIGPERSICPGLPYWQTETGMTWFPVIARRRP